MSPLALVVLGLCTGPTAAGRIHKRGNLLAGHSALAEGARSLPFDRVSVVDNVNRNPRESGDRSASLRAHGAVTPGQPLRISWSDVSAATADDVIAVTCADRGWGLVQAFDAVRASGKPAGSTELPPLPDLRCVYVLRYLRAQPPRGAAVEAELRLEHALAPGLMPTQVHLSFTDDRGGIMLIWVSGHADAAPVVEWGVASGAYTANATGTSSTYRAADMCDAPANQTGPLDFISPGWIHRVPLTGLPPSTTIFYRLGHGAAMTAEASFTSRKPANADSVKFIMYADQALPVAFFAPAWRLVNQVVDDLKAGFDGFLLHPGDLGYAEGSGFIWDVWGELIEPISSRVAYMVTVGNHEYDHAGLRPDPSGAPAGGWHPHETTAGGVPWGNLGDDSHGECGVPVTARFNGTNSAGSNGVYWYSFNEGGVHAVVLSSEHDWTRGSVQHQWLADDLAAVNRSLTPWVVLATHRMMYTTQLLEGSDYNVSLGFRDHVEPLLRAGKVNLMLVGHQHSYERSCPVYNGSCVAAGHGTVHIVAGSAGATAERGNFSTALGNFSIRHVDDYGYLRVDANRTRMLVQFVRTNKHDGGEAGTVWDEVELLPWP